MKSHRPHWLRNDRGIGESDQVPISRHEKIVVKQMSPSERDVKPSDDGTLKWTLDLKPGEKRELTVKFSIDYPNDLPVVGVDA